MPERTQLSPKAAVAFGLFAALMGVLAIGVALGIIPTERPGDAPRWVGVAAGIAFVLAGAAIIVGFAVAAGSCHSNLNSSFNLRTSSSSDDFRSGFWSARFKRSRVNLALTALPPLTDPCP